MPRPRRDAGLATAEFAVALPAIVLVLALAVCVLGAMLDQVRCVDAARAGARAAARGDTTPAVLEAARGLAPSGAAITVTPGAGDVVVRVVAEGPGFGPAWPSELRPRAEAAMPLESGAEGGASPVGGGVGGVGTAGAGVGR